MDENDRQPTWSTILGRKAPDMRHVAAVSGGHLLRWTVNIVLLAYLGGLCYVSVSRYDRVVMQPWQASLSDELNWSPFLASLALGNLLVLAQFVLLGGLLYNAYHWHRKQQEADSREIRRWPVVIIGLLLTVVLVGLRLGRVPDVFVMLLPIFGLLLGVWVTSNVLRGFGTTIWLVPKLLLLLAFFLGLGVVAFSGIAAEEPLEFVPAQATAADKVSLAYMIRHREEQEDGTDRLVLTERDLNMMMATGFERLPIEGKAVARLRRDAIALDFSLGLPIDSPFGRYVNCEGVYHIQVREGDLSFRPDLLRIGRVEIPPWLLGALGDYAVTTVEDDANARAMLASMDELVLTRDGVVAVCQSEKLREELKLAFQEYLGESPDVVEATADHTRHLVASAPDFADSNQRFAAFLRTAFQFAKDRTSAGADAVDENRAAIFALAIVLGHHKVEYLVGEVTDERVREEIDKYRGKVTLRGRPDLTRHFFVSAGLSLGFNPDISGAAGLLKEEVDSGGGGSGLSFPDLLADEAGTKFAAAATKDRDAAQRMQDLLAESVSIDEIFPPVTGLPEGIQDAELQRDFGGVGGTTYNEVVEDIQRRLAACRVLNIQ